MQNDIKKAYIQLHLAVFIFGFTAILGKLIQADHFTLVWHRMWLAALGFLFVPGFISSLKKVSFKQMAMLAGIGMLVALHWLSFYGSIKIGNSASLTLGCFGLTSAFTSVLEPLIYRKRFVLLDVLLGLMALAGIAIIAWFAPEQSDVSGNYTLAIIVGVISTFLAALFSTLNSTLTNTIDTKVISFAELGGGFLFLSVLLGLGFGIEGVLDTHSFQALPLSDANGWLGKYSDVLWILLLAIVCTNIAFVLNLNAMKRLSAFTANLAINLEPVYGIILAALFFNEHQFLNWQFYIGASVILLSVIIHSIIKYRGKH
ncbi:MAG: DMT family transporter [Chitinophagaceae bacterium]